METGTGTEYEYIIVDDVRDRCLRIAEYIIDHNSTVRQTAKVFGISKSTVHKDITVCLEKRNAALALEVKKILEKNKSERHIRGGEATRKKYMSIKSAKSRKG